MSLPTPAKRRHFEPSPSHAGPLRRQRASHRDEDEGDEAADEEEPESGAVRPIGSRLGHATSSSVNARIGHFERLSKQRQEFADFREPPPPPAATSGRGHYEDEAMMYDDEDRMYDLEGQHDELDGLEGEEEEDYLVLDTIVEEEEEEENEPPSVLQSGAAGERRLPGRDKQQIDCDRAAHANATATGRLVRQSAARPEPPDDDDEADSAPGLARNNARRVGPAGELERERQPPAEPLGGDINKCDRDGDGALPGEESDSAHRRRSNKGPLVERKQNSEPPISENQRSEKSTTSAYGGSETMSLSPSENKQQNIDLDESSLDFCKPSSEQRAECEQATGGAGQASATRPRGQTQNNNKMHYQTLLPSTNRLISEHQARQEQALFRALNERQKILDELNPDERLKQADLMSSSLSLRLHKQVAHRQWRKSSSTSGGQRGHEKSSEKNSPGHQRHRHRRRRQALSSSTGRLNQNGHAPRRSASKGVPLSAVDLSSMTDQQVEELLGQLAPASSSSSLASAGASASSSLDDSDDSDLSTRSSSSSGSGSDSDSSSATCSTSSSCSSSGPDERHSPHRHRWASSGAGSAANPSEAQTNGSSRRRPSASSNHHHPRLAPSVVGVHEDGNAVAGADLRPHRPRHAHKSGGASGSLASRKCREAHRGQRRRDGRSDEDEEERDRRHRGDLSVSVGGAGGAGPPSAGQEAPGGGVGQSSLSPLAQTAGGGGLSLGSSSLGPLSCGPHTTTTASSPVSQTQSDNEPASLPGTSGACASASGRAEGHQSVEAILGRMLGALDEVAGAHEEQEQLNELLERGFLHLEQLLNCSLAPQQQQQAAAAARSQLTINRQPQQQQQLQSSQKDSDYGSDTQSTGECFSTSTSNSASSSESQAAAATAGTATGGGQGLSPLAIELSFKLAESLRRLAGQQAASRRAREQQQVSPAQPEATAAAASLPRVRMKSVVMINSPASACSSSPASSRPESSAAQAAESSLSSRNPTPLVDSAATAATDSRPSSRQSQGQRHEPFKTRVSLNSAGAGGVATPEPRNCETQIVKVVAALPTLERRQSRRSSFRNSSLRRRPSLSAGGAPATAIGPRPGSPVPRSVLEQQQQQQVQIVLSGGSPAQQQATSVVQPPGGPMKPSRSTCPVGGPKAEEAAAATQEEPLQAKLQKERQLQRALVLAQKYNYSPAKLAASKLSAKLQLGELICAGQPPGGPSSGEQTATTGDTNGQAPHSRKPINNRRLEDERQTPTVSGQVELDISYFAKSGSLTVHLLQCAQLASVSKRRTTSNPYVKLYLLPDRTKAGKRKSSVKRRQLDPKFDERFTFGPLKLHEFDSKILWLSVWHKDRGLKRNEFLGQLFLPLSRVRHQLLTSDLSCQSTASKWYKLTDLTDRLEPDSRDAKQQVVAGPLAENNLLTTKRVPQSSAHLSMTLARAGQGPATPTGVVPRVQQQQAAEMVAKKLSEFERKAALLTQQSQLLAAVAPPGGNSASQEHETRLLRTLDRNHKGAPQSTASQAGEGASKLANGQQRAPVPVPKTMQVTLGQLSASQSNQAAGQPGHQQAITGQLFVALKFVPEMGGGGEVLARRASASMEGDLHVLIKEARNIGGAKQVAGGGSNPTQTSNNNNQSSNEPLPSPFCKCYLLDSQGQRLAKQRTSQLKRTNSPRWDQELVFGNLKLAHLQAQAVEIQLFNRDSILVSSSEHLGAIRLCRRLRDAEEAPTTDKLQPPHDQPSSTLTSNASNGVEQLANSATASLRSSASSKSSGSCTSHSQDEDLCSERESRLWAQMLTRPNIWVYGELPLRQLRPLVALPAQVQSAQ